MSKRPSLAGLARPKPGGAPAAPAGPSGPAPASSRAAAGAAAAGVPAEEEEMHAMTLRVPKATSKALKLRAIDEDRPVSDIIREAIDDYLRTHRR